jgi:hypothetical protein
MPLKRKKSVCYTPAYEILFKNRTIFRKGYINFYEMYGAIASWSIYQHPIIMSRVRFVFLIVVTTLFSCEQPVTGEQLEREVLNEIFIKVVDSTYKDKRIYTSLPERGKDIFDHNGNWVGKDTVGQGKRDIDHKILIEALKNDTLNLVIAIGKGGLINDQTELQHYCSRKFIFKHLSELQPASEYDNWTAKYPKFAGVLVFSTIKFDVTNEHGSLDVSYHCGGKCGLGYRVTIKKVNRKWAISKVEDTWIS